MHVEEKVLLVNRMQNLNNSWPHDVLETFGQDKIISLPEDPLLSQYDLEGKPTISLPGDSPIVKSAWKLFDRLFRKYQN
jgi:CO dehydrogenase maturation factor